jgi:amphi-Trp domain-containing protein
MPSEDVDLEFEFSNEELANFLESFSEKIREGEVGLSFKGREEVEITPSTDSQLEMQFHEGDTYKSLKLDIQLHEELDSTEEGRRKINVKVV